MHTLWKTLFLDARETLRGASPPSAPPLPPAAPGVEFLIEAGFAGAEFSNALPIDDLKALGDAGRKR